MKRLKKSVISGICAAVLFAVSAGMVSDFSKDCFLFPGFLLGSSIQNDKTKVKEIDTESIVFSFKIVEIFKEIFS